MHLQLKDKVAAITGGGSGIGRASCLAFAKAGASVVVASRTLHKAEAVADEIRGAGASAFAVQVDVSNGPAVQHTIEVAVANFGSLDILFNNAGISPSGRVTDISESEWDECIAVDLRSVFLGAKYAIPELQKLIQAEEVAALAVYLASDAAKMITGQIFVIDGGQQAGLY